MAKSKAKKIFKKRVEWDDSVIPRESHSSMGGFCIFLFFVFSIITFLNDISIEENLIVAKITICCGIGAVIFFILSQIPKRKVYWEEVKEND
ncbi:MAG: hypothetical protein ACOCT9_02520 [archaeon]